MQEKEKMEEKETKGMDWEGWGEGGRRELGLKGTSREMGRQTRRVERPREVQGMRGSSKERQGGTGGRRNRETETRQWGCD